MSDYIKQISGFEVLSTEEEIELFKRFEKGDREAYEALYNHNLRLVVAVAKHYFNVISGMEPIDIVMEGNLGLTTAICRFDYRKGYKFSTYASWWIRQAITRALSNTSSLIRLPVHMQEALLRYRKYMNKLEEEKRSCPSIEEIAKDLNITTDQVIMYQAIDSNMINPVSLNMIINQDDDADTELMDFISSDTNIENEYIEKDLRKTLLELLDQWVEHFPERTRERQRDIIIRRFGLNNKKPETLATIGESYGVTRELVRQVEKKFIKYARHPRNKRKLAAYIDP